MLLSSIYYLVRFRVNGTSDGDDADIGKFQGVFFMAELKAVWDRKTEESRGIQKLSLFNYLYVLYNLNKNPKSTKESRV